MKTKDFIKIWPKIYPIIKQTNSDRQTNFIRLYEIIYNIPENEQADYSLSDAQRSGFMEIVNEFYDAYFLTSAKPKEIKIAGKNYLIKEIQKTKYPLSVFTILNTERIKSLKSVENPEIVEIQRKQIQGVELNSDDNKLLYDNLIDANYTLYDRINFIAALALAPIVFKKNISDSDVEILSNKLLHHEHSEVLNIAFFLLSRQMNGWSASMNYWQRDGLSHGFRIFQNTALSGITNTLR